MPCFSGNGKQPVAYFVSSEQVYGVVGSNLPQDVLLAIFGRVTALTSLSVLNVDSYVVPQDVAIPGANVDVGTILDLAVPTFVITETLQVGTLIAEGVPTLVVEDEQDTGTNVGLAVDRITGNGTQDVKFFVDTNVCC